MLLAGRAQMHVRVDERGQQRAAGSLDHLGARRRLEAVSEFGDLAVAHEHVEPRVHAFGRIEDARAAHEQVGGASRCLRQAPWLASAHAAPSGPASRS